MPNAPPRWNSCKPRTRWIRNSATAALLLLAGACATPPPASNCAGWVEVVPTPAEIDALGDETLMDIDRNNLLGQALGCWEYP